MKKIILSLSLLFSSFFVFAAAEVGGPKQFPEISDLIEEQSKALDTNLRLLSTIENKVSLLQKPKKPEALGRATLTYSLLKNIEGIFSNFSSNMYTMLTTLKDSFNRIDIRAKIHSDTYAKRTYILRDFNDLAVRQVHIDFTKEFAPEARDQEHEDAFLLDHKIRFLLR